MSVTISENDTMLDATAVILALLLELQMLFSAVAV